MGTEDIVVVCGVAFFGSGIVLMLGLGLWLLVEARDTYGRTMERLHRRQMETFDKFITLENARNGRPKAPSIHPNE